MTNPFALQESKSAGTLVESERAIQEIQAAMVIAKRFPRDQKAAMDRILQSCTRPTLAQQALYAYPRGGQMVTGPSIRMAEALAQNWGNIQFGLRELDQVDGVSTVQAFAWDIETNVRQIKEFQVKHERSARGELKRLTDPRDIYEMVANQGARRMRACILSVIPGDVQDAAVAQCELTLQNLEGAPEEQIKGLAEAFEELGVTRKQLETRLGHRLDSTISAEVIQLRKIYRSIKDGMSGIDDWFETDAKPTATSDAAEKVMAKAREDRTSARQVSTPASPEWPQERDGVLYDIRGIPWSAEIHSGAKSCTHDGIWRRRRGVSAERIREIEEPWAESKESGGPETGSATPETETKEQVTNSDELEMLSEGWFNRGISQSGDLQDLLEYEQLLIENEGEMDAEVFNGLRGKIAHRRAELESNNETRAEG